MQIEIPVVSKTVEDYDIIHDSGANLPLTIDRLSGDTIDIGDKVILVHITAKPSKNDPATMLPAEDITVYVSKVTAIHHRVRVVIEQSKEQKEQWYKTFQELTTASNLVN